MSDRNGKLVCMHTVTVFFNNEFHFKVFFWTLRKKNFKNFCYLSKSDYICSPYVIGLTLFKNGC